MERRDRHNLFLGLAFLSPNILGFLAFTIIPLVFSLVLAFSNWDLKLHNMFKDEPLKFVGLDNFIRLISEENFRRFLGNTLFFMIGIPFGITASLVAAILLSKDLRGGSRRVFAYLFAGAVLVASVGLLSAIGAGGTGIVILLVGLACTFLVAGVAGGSTVYRTLFYTPHFTAGVATFLLWKKLYNPHTGPVNTFLSPVLDRFSDVVNATSPSVVQAGMALFLGLLLLTFAFGMNRLRTLWRDGDVGWAATVMPVLFLLAPAVVCFRWLPTGASRYAVPVISLLLVVTFLIQMLKGPDFPCRPAEGIGTALTLSLALMVAEFIFLGLGIVSHNLPAMAADGLEPPYWLASYHWAKPAIMIMGFWGAIGSNNMLLYLAALSNVPEELYEAAGIDGATRFQKFWHVTWPQLAPTTFFIVVMSVIGGLQGGFEMAYTMTRGGPAGSTTTLSYFIFTEGFETGRLGYSSAIAWTMFLLVFLVTLFNWRVGNRYVND